MESQTIIIPNSLYTAPATIPSFYKSHHTPPYTFNWSETVYKPFSMNEDVLQMKQLRFPTPPMTPPRGLSTITVKPATVLSAKEIAKEDKHKTQQHRTLSVIMKIGYDQNPQYLPANLPYLDTLVEVNKHAHSSHYIHRHKLQDQQQSHNDTPSSGTSSPISHNEFICEWRDCGRYLESLELLAHHVTIIHAVASLTDGLYYCRWTGCQRTERGFNARYKMLVHVRTHTKEKPHQCHLCEKRFSRAENLKIHTRSHSGEKPYICTFGGCNKAYSNSSDRFKHTRTHSMEKPYMCKVSGCHKRYTDPSSLRKHVKTFKHSVQIVEFKASLNVQQQPASLISGDIKSCFSFMESYKKYSPYLILQNAQRVKTNQDSFCMEMKKMCKIKATLNYYPMTTMSSVDQESTWLQDEIETKDSRPCKHTPVYKGSTDYLIQRDCPTDMPLDLRTKRC